MSHIEPTRVTFLEDTTYIRDSERKALTEIRPKGFYIRQPPRPYELLDNVTSEEALFQTIDMGAAIVDCDHWTLVVDGLVERPFFINLAQLRRMPWESIISFHECYGSPLTAPTKNGTFVWSDGLDSGMFAGVSADRYQKELPIKKALSLNVLVAYEMNGQPVSTERGGPAKLVVPGWYGTNSTKWLCRLSVEETRSSNPFTTMFYNEVDPTDLSSVRMRPVWEVEPNSMIVRPRPEEMFPCHNHVEVWGGAWDAEEIVRVEFEWQFFRLRVLFSRSGRCIIQVRATDSVGTQQPLSNRRNHVPTVQIQIE
ncbi:Oxidoreductase, molybdopterin-binding domain-containing protein [Aspergillus minisclerotigenes]|uniref:Oxidoreductase, molybdopterin-binding domain-containing protein n=1 Tax=Aspergillus minisclerotigenes TaxID=656917 RepID=A0A5N6J9I1_9EURO|nr:Oxidoreductase, molybdopterin-binding domain-containing protein [Aspergillus minisclerotigenes]